MWFTIARVKHRESKLYGQSTLVFIRGPRRRLHRLLDERLTPDGLDYGRVAMAAALLSIARRGLSVHRYAFRRDYLLRALERAGLELHKIYPERALRRLPSWVEKHLNPVSERRREYVYIVPHVNVMPSFVLKRALADDEGWALFSRRLVVGSVSIKRLSKPEHIDAVLACPSQLQLLSTVSERALQIYKALREENLVGEEEYQTMARLLAYARLASL